MKNSKYLLIKFAAIVFVIAALVCALPSAGINQAGQRDVTSSPKLKRVTMFDDLRPELSIERLLDLDHPRGFDPDSVSLLKPQQDEQQRASNQNFASYQAIASTTRRGKGDMNP
jgi:hypothetical protein